MDLRTVSGNHFPIGDVNRLWQQSMVRLRTRLTAELRRIFSGNSGRVLIDVL